MVTITTLTEKAIAVTGLPEGAKCTIANNVINDSCITLIVKDKHGNNTWHKLPEGNWTILGRAAELTEDDWKRVVGEDNRKLAGFVTDQERFDYLLKEKGLHVTNPLMSEKPITVIGHKGQEKICELILERFQEQWQSAELLTNPLILINEQRIWQKENKPV